MIALNTVCMAGYDYTDPDSLTLYNQTIDQINMGCTIVYVVEAVLKIIAMGFFSHRCSYIWEVSNALDFFIVICG